MVSLFYFFGFTSSFIHLLGLALKLAARHRLAVNGELGS